MSDAGPPLRVGIIGSRGNNAATWTDAMLARGRDVVQLVREPHALPPREGVQRRRLDLDDPQGFEPALSGLTVLGLATPAEPAQVDRETALIQAAQRAGVERIVKLSVLGADREQPISFFARSAATIERTLAALPVNRVLLRPGFFMQNLLRQRASIESGTLIDPYGGRPTVLIDVLDIAAVAAVVVAGAYDGQALPLSGPAGLTAQQIADTLGAATGRPVAVHAVDPDELHSAQLTQGTPRWAADAQRELAIAVREGRAEFANALVGTVRDTTGAHPRSFEQFAETHFGSAWRRAVAHSDAG